MNRVCSMLLCGLLICQTVDAQREMTSLYTQQQLEDLSERGITDTEDDSFIQRLHFFSRHPLNLNKAAKEDLEELGLLNDIQINQLLTYRRLLGNLVSVYELQAIPGWNPALIQSVLPYITLADVATRWNRLKKTWQQGEHSLLLRYSTLLEKPAGYTTDTSGTSRYLGSPAKLYMRYQYKNKEGIQLGLVAEKDAGEQFFRGSQRAGFDFYSFHLAVAKIGILKQLIIGDYTISMAQGLVQWQGLSLGRGSGLVAAERQASVVRPYSSPGEASFHRGAALSLQKGNWELISFVSRRALSAHLEADTITGQSLITSLLMSGYHRTANELLTKNNSTRLTTGAACLYSTNTLKLTLQGVHHSFSKPFHKEDQPYNLFAPKGSSFTNLSLGYSFTHRNLHVFGETAVDKNLHHASINGLLLSLHPTVDLAIIHRMIAREYQSAEANANTQSTQPINESGLNTGITLRPFDGLTVEAVADLYRFPWLRYRVDAPSVGKEYSLQLSYSPTKQVEITSRFRWHQKPLSATAGDDVMTAVKAVRQANWRLQLNAVMSKSISLQNRCEMVWYNKARPDAAQGYLIFSQLQYRAADQPFSGTARVQWVEADGYNARLYAYENSVLYAFSIPAFFEKGFRYYCNLRINVLDLLGARRSWRMDCWMHWAQSIYPGKRELGEGADRIAGNKKSELTLQLIINR